MSVERTADLAAGFTVPYVELPRPAAPLDPGSRDRAAAVVLALIHWFTPEEVELGDADEKVHEVWGDEVTRREAFDFVDMLAVALEVPR